MSASERESLSAVAESMRDKCVDTVREGLSYAALDNPWADKEAYRAVLLRARQTLDELVGQRDEKHRQLEAMHTWGEEWKAKYHAENLSWTNLYDEHQVTLARVTALETALGEAVRDFHTIANGHPVRGTSIETTIRDRIEVYDAHFTQDGES